MMAFKKVKRVLFRVFKRGHPDVYAALKTYCEEKGLNMSDVLASSTAAWMAMDEDAKGELEERMKERRTGGGGKNIKAGLEVFKDICAAMGDMFKTMNEARAGMSMASMLSDFKAVATTMEEMKKAGSEAGKGSIEDALADAFVRNIFGRFGATPPATKTGTGKVTKVEE